MAILKRSVKKLWVYGLAILFLFGGWWLLALLINHQAFPMPQLALLGFFNALKKGLFIHIGVSFYRVIISLLLALFLAIPLGLMMGKNPSLDAYLAPLVYLTYPVPKVVFMPIFFVLLGIGDLSKILLIALIVFFQILVTTRDGARNLEKEYIASVKSLGASSWDLYAHVYFPGTLPEILTSLRLGLGTAMAVLFLTETYATQQGIGYYIMDALSKMAYIDMFAGIIAMALMGFFLYLLIDVIEKRVCVWKFSN